MKPFSAVFLAVLAVGLAFALLLLNLLDYRDACAVKLVMGLTLGSFLFGLKGHSRANGAIVIASRHPTPILKNRSRRNGISFQANFR